MELHGKTLVLGSKITVDNEYSHENKRRLLLGRKVMTNLDSIFKSKDVTLPTKVRLVKAMVFPVVIQTCNASDYRNKIVFPRVNTRFWD